MGGIRFSDLVQVRAGFGGYTFQALHILNEKLTFVLDLSQVGTVLPRHADSREDQTLSPDRVKACRIRIYTGYLSASHHAMGEILRIYSCFLGLWKKKELTGTRKQIA